MIVKGMWQVAREAWWLHDKSSVAYQERVIVQEESCCWLTVGPGTPTHAGCSHKSRHHCSTATVHAQLLGSGLLLVVPSPC